MVEVATVLMGAALVILVGVVCVVIVAIVVSNSADRKDQREAELQNQRNRE